MLDLKFIRSHLQEVKQALINRGQEFLLDDFESLDEMRRLLLGEVESRRQERNSLSEEVGRQKKAEQDPATLMERVREIDWTKKVVLICRTGSRSLWLAHTLGPDYPVFNLFGGIKACFEQGGFPGLVVLDQEKTIRYLQ